MNLKKREVKLLDEELKFPVATSNLTKAFEVHRDLVLTGLTTESRKKRKESVGVVLKATKKVILLSESESEWEITAGLVAMLKCNGFSKPINGMLSVDQEISEEKKLKIQESLTKYTSKSHIDQNSQEPMHWVHFSRSKPVER